VCGAKSWVRPALASVLAAVAALACVGGLSRSQDVPAPPKKDFAGQKAHKVVRALDGDTVELQVQG